MAKLLTTNTLNYLLPKDRKIKLKSVYPAPTDINDFKTNFASLYLDDTDYCGMSLSANVTTVEDIISWAPIIAFNNGMPKSFIYINQYNPKVKIGSGVHQIDWMDDIVLASQLDNKLNKATIQEIEGLFGGGFLKRLFHRLRGGLHYAR